MGELLRKLATAMAQCGDGVASFDVDWNVEFVNPSWASMHAYEAEDLKGKPINLFFSDDVFDKDVVAFTEKVVQTGKHEAELQHLDGHGQAFTALLKGVLVTGKAGEPAGYVLIAAPLGGRERTLREREQNYRVFLEDAAIGFFMLDLTGKIFFANKALEIQTGYSKEMIETEGLSFASLVIEEDLPKAFVDFQKVASGLPNAGPRTYRCRTKSGEIRLGEVNTLPITVGGNIVGFHGTVVDVTQRMAAAEKLQRVEKLESVAALAQGVAKDFDRILSDVTEYAALATADLSPDSRARAAIFEIARAGQKAKSLVDHLLAFGQQSGQNPKPIRLQDVLENTVKFLRVSLPSSIELRIEVDHDCPAIFANPAEMNQVLMNLFANACDAMWEKGGALSVSLKSVTLDELGAQDCVGLEPGRYVNLTVCDTGMGMDEETKRRVFEPYFTTKKQGESSGMGLAISYGIVRRCGGEIDVQSQLGQGTTFCVHIPQCSGDYDDRAKPWEYAPMLGRNERILFADDDETLLAFYRDYLTDLGYRVLTFASSFDALDAILRWPDEFQVAVIDQSLPKMHGLDLARRVLDVRPDLPVILLGSYDHPVSLDETKKIGVYERLEKPFSSYELAASIRHVLEDHV